MRVVTLNHKDVEELCKGLLEDVRHSGFSPDIVLAVRTGGAEVGKIFFDLLRRTNSKNCTYLECDITRKSTRKKRWLTKMAKVLPLWLRNALRIAEAKLSFGHKSRHEFEKIGIPDELRHSAHSHILVIDDAVDSGATLQAVVNELKKVCPSATVRCAALTVTSDQPIFEPDFFSYHNQTLLRFPWSMDATNQ